VVPDVAAPVEVIVLDDPAPAAVLADLRARDVRALLCEGGPTLFGSLLAGGLCDELFFTLFPVLSGDVAEPGITAGDRFPAPIEAELLWVRQAGSELLLRYAV
jgi:5-amino-6-(5-phosphoribosylamino)uracil reductase